MRSLKSRLIAAAVIWISVGIVAAGFGLSAVFRQHITEQFHEELFVHLDELQRLATINSSGAHLQRHFSDPRYDLDQSGFYWEIQREAQVVARSASLKGPMLKTPDDGPKDIGVHTHNINGPTGPLIVAERADWKSPTESPLRYLIGTDKRHLEGVMSRFDRTLFGALGALAVTMIAAASMLIAYALRPLSQLHVALMGVRTGRDNSLAGSFPFELQPLIDDLNALLASTSDLIQRARSQAGNLAHGLRTPLAVLTDEAHRIKAQGLDKASSTILDECWKMQKQIDYQIARARAGASRAAPGVTTSALKAVSDVQSALARLHKDRKLRIECDVSERLMVTCDTQDLNEILANLVDNACKHCTSRVLLSARQSLKNDRVCINVEDDGPGLPPEAFELVFNIGERWDSKAPGSGLGLAIVRDLARLYNGEVTLGRSKLGGLNVKLELPGSIGT